MTEGIRLFITHDEIIVETDNASIRFKKFEINPENDGVTGSDLSRLFDAFGMLNSLVTNSPKSAFPNGAPTERVISSARGRRSE